MFKFGFKHCSFLWSTTEPWLVWQSLAEWQPLRCPSEWQRSSTCHLGNYDCASLSVYTYEYVYLCLCLYISVCMCVSVCMLVCVYVCVCGCVCMRLCVHASVCACYITMHYIIFNCFLSCLENSLRTSLHTVMCQILHYSKEPSHFSCDLYILCIKYEFKFVVSPMMIRILFTLNFYTV